MFGITWPVRGSEGIFINLVHQAHTYCKTVDNPREGTSDGKAGSI